MSTKKNKGQALLCLATNEGVLVERSIGYRSRRKRWRDTPDKASMAKTRSEGARLSLAIQPETEPCDLSPSLRASAVCPPTASHASNNASNASDGSSAFKSLMSGINAQTVNCVNAYSGNMFAQTFHMGRKAESPPSKFWIRLTEAFSEQGLSTTQNGIATLLGMSQGSVGRWYHNEGLPELETCIDLANRGKVSVDWLLTGRKPKYLISKDRVITEIIEMCEDMDDEAKGRILRAARGEKLQQQQEVFALTEAARKRS